MDMEKQKIKINIAGTPYNILTDNEPGYALKLSREIDSKITEVMNSGRFVSSAQATVITLLEYADSLAKTSKELEDLKKQLKENLEDAAQAKSERDMLKREIIKIRKGGNP